MGGRGRRGRAGRRRPGRPGPRRAVVDSREAGEGDLFVGLHGANADGSRFAQDAIDAGAWGVLVGPARARELVESGASAPVIASPNTLHALGALARAWRHELGCKVIGVTGSTGKTSTKDILAALLAPHMRTHRNRENWNTEIGLPLTVLEAEPGTEAMVLEMAMRGEGQIAELAAIADPDVGLIVNVGPVHLELLGTIERVAATKAELIRDLHPEATAVVPAGEGAARGPPARRHRDDHLRRGGRRRAPVVRVRPRGDRRPRRDRSSWSCPSRRTTTSRTRSRPSRRRTRSASRPRAASTSRSRRCGARSSSCRAR